MQSAATHRNELLPVQAAAAPAAPEAAPVAVKPRVDVALLAWAWATTGLFSRVRRVLRLSGSAAAATWTMAAAATTASL